ncbi:hypothetical protein ACFP3I_03615 [Chryseobacterium arachidis]|uniref:hypothetical protein n=1 Tax=Chryseobacterium arachidis TaxID=1416778 RepID=UPI00362419FD
MRPARLPIPPPGLVCYLVSNWCANIGTFLYTPNVFVNFFLKIYLQTVVGKVYSGWKLFIFNIM